MVLFEFFVEVNWNSAERWHVRRRGLIHLSQPWYNLEENSLKSAEHAIYLDFSIAPSIIYHKTFFCVLHIYLNRCALLNCLRHLPDGLFVEG